MHCRSCLVAAVLLAVAPIGLAACVEVPDGIRAQFAGPGPQDRSNFRPGRHGEARPAEDAPATAGPAPKEAGDAAPESHDGAGATDAADAGSPS
jgi:hypothetical protein